MKKLILWSTCGLVACGPSYTQTVKTPDEILAEQEALGAEQVKNSKESGATVDDESTDAEQKQKFDERYTELEVSRAIRSAETCPGVSGEGPYGVAKVSITFTNDGHVVDSKTTISAPFAGTVNGDCVLRAMNAIITKNFVGPEVTKELDIKLAEPKKEDKKKK